MNISSQNKIVFQNFIVNSDAYKSISVDLKSVHAPSFEHERLEGILSRAKWVNGRQILHIGVRSEARIDVVLADGTKLDRSINFSTLIGSHILQLELQALDQGYSFKCKNINPQIKKTAVHINICDRKDGSLNQIFGRVYDINYISPNQHDLLNKTLCSSLYLSEMERMLFKVVCDHMSSKPVIMKESVLRPLTDNNFKLIQDTLSEGGESKWLDKCLEMLDIAKGLIPQYKFVHSVDQMTIYDFECLFSLDKMHHLLKLSDDPKLKDFLNKFPGFVPLYVVPSLQPKETIAHFGFLAMLILRVINKISYQKKWVD